jgi:hypothetical protein
MDIKLIVQRVAEGLVAVDSSTTTINKGKKGTYLAGAFTLKEPQFVREFKEWWERTYPSDFGADQKCSLAHRYPDVMRARCDLVILKHDRAGETIRSDWAIEFKRIAFVGNNGKNNDFGLAKVISPYLKDRSLIHDVRRLRSSSIAKKKAVIMYGFEYDKASIQESKDTCARIGVSEVYATNLAGVLKSVDPTNFRYSLKPIQDILNYQFQRDSLVKGEPRVSLFKGADRHPCGGKGRIVGWLISEP